MLVLPIEGAFETSADRFLDFVAHAKPVWGTAHCRQPNGGPQSAKPRASSPPPSLSNLHHLEDPGGLQDPRTTRKVYAEYIYIYTFPLQNPKELRVSNKKTLENRAFTEVLSVNHSRFGFTGRCYESQEERLALLDRRVSGYGVRLVGKIPWV